MKSTFDLQGHRAARGLKPENTLPAFEVAFDLGVTSVETDVHLTADGIPILFHDPVVSDRLCQVIPDGPAADLEKRPKISSLTLAQMRGYRADRNPDPQRFPQQDSRATPLAQMFAERQGIDPFTPPTLADLFDFATAYASNLGATVGKSERQRQRVREVRFDLELKRVPFRPDVIGDDYAGDSLSSLEQEILVHIGAAGMMERTTVRSFDHRCIRLLRKREPRLNGAVLVAGTAPVSPADLATQADAQTYCPDFEFLDGSQVRRLHAAGLRIVPWTVNEPEDWAGLLDWGVDGITTDYPDRLAAFLSGRGVVF
jgi:glycerophosphoryl diester phosphodiesterase